MKKINLIKQIWLTIGVTCIAIFGMGAFGYFESSHLFSKLDKVSNVNLPVANAMSHTDMMHDNIKGNVFAALYYFNQGNFAELEASLNDNKEAGKKIKENMDFIDKSPLSAKT